MSALPATSDPPSYSQPDENLFGNFDVVVPLDDILPGYTSVNQPSSGSTTVIHPSRAPTTRPHPKEFQYKIKSGKGAPIAVLTLIADALYSKDIPTYVGSGPIKGNVRLRADKADGVQAIAISIIGRFTTGIGEEEATFIELSTTVYSSSSELPKAEDDSYLWPFESKIPEEQTLTVKRQGQEVGVHFVPPQTFAEPALPGSIKYEIGMKIKRDMLRMDYRISTAIRYIPLIRPPPFPLLRSLAYEQGTQLVGPDNDHEGWHALEEVRIKVPLLTTTSDAEIGCTLYMAQPLSYTIGTSIPLVIRLTAPAGSRDALDALLRTPNAIAVRLRRTVASHLPHRKLKSSDNYHMVSRKEIRDLYEAVWWAPEDTQAGEAGNVLPPEAVNIDSNDHIRWMHGEIHLGKEVKPSSGMPHFRIKYALVLLPFIVPGTTSAETIKIALREQVVEMATSFAPGPRPVRCIPPGYTSNIVPTDDPCNRVVGTYSNV